MTKLWCWPHTVYHKLQENLWKKNLLHFASKIIFEAFKKSSSRANGFGKSMHA